MDDSIISQIKDRIRLSDVISPHVRLAKVAGRFKGRCPFHSEKTPSFNVDDAKGYYHCFGCHKSGDAIAFLQDYKNLSFQDALLELANLAGVELPKFQPKEPRDGKKSVYDLLDSACEIMQANLKSFPQASKYASMRGISALAIEKFRIGYCGVGRSFLADALLSKGFAPNDIINSGVCIQKEGLLDRFFDRIIFPIADSKGRVLGFSGRTWKNGDERPKYLNSSENDVFKKRSIVYNLHNARKSREKFCIVVEGYMDVITLDSAGVANIVAQMGTATTEEQIDQIWKTFDEVVFCLDSDNAGKAASIRAVEVLLPKISTEKTASFMKLGAKDPDELIKSRGISAWHGAVLARKSLSDFMWESYSDGIDPQNPQSLAKLEFELTSLAEKIKNPLLQKHYKSFFSRKVYELRFQKSRPLEVRFSSRDTEKFTYQEALCAFIFKHFEELGDDIFEKYDIEFREPILQKLFLEVLNLVPEKRRVFVDSSVFIKNLIQKLEFRLTPKEKSVLSNFKALHERFMLEKIDEEIEKSEDFDVKKVLFLEKRRLEGEILAFEGLKE